MRNGFDSSCHRYHACIAKIRGFLIPVQDFIHDVSSRDTSVTRP